MKMMIGDIELIICDSPGSESVSIRKHYNSSKSSDITLNVDNIYQLEFAIHEAKRKLKLL